MRERVTTFTPFAAIGVAGGVLGLCCGLPVLLSLGVLGAVAGLSVSSLSVSSWALIGLGLALAALECARWLRGRRSTSSNGRLSTPHVPHGPLPDRTVGATKGHHL